MHQVRTQLTNPEVPQHLGRGMLVELTSQALLINRQGAAGPAQQVDRVLLELVEMVDQDSIGIV